MSGCRRENSWEGLVWLMIWGSSKLQSWDLTEFLSLLGLGAWGWTAQIEARRILMSAPAAFELSPSRSGLILLTVVMGVLAFQFADPGGISFCWSVLLLIFFRLWDLLRRKIYLERYCDWFIDGPLEDERKLARWNKRKAFFAARLGFQEGALRWAGFEELSGVQVDQGVRCDPPPVLEKIRKAYLRSVR